MPSSSEETSDARSRAFASIIKPSCSGKVRGFDATMVVCASVPWYERASLQTHRTETARARAVAKYKLTTLSAAVRKVN